ncbi:folate/biopterin family MFS transporter [Falsiroseomonas selenitidurans]|uniref:Folate/biopterin family MFS transporter n=1 Tax=Falsiroseomonas selenitidurans TaxID=2716335 RepID=A0ABX1E3V8_9PROT|nr:folate/biopterin family MFS transporter [Falsiroseomonas selenitidurans]NKC31453.1 folate/biopterin family MFS transporter [Falsiroseomonas selenitidurans]
MIEATEAPRRGLLAPLGRLNRRTAPPLLIYLVAGAAGFPAIAETFWVRNSLGLSPQDLLALAAWLTVPWTLKMVIGHMVDTVPILGSRRRAYVLLGAALQVAANLALAAAAAGMTAPVPAETAYVAASLAAVIGLVVQDSVADAMTTEVVDRTEPDGTPRPTGVVQAELGDVQVLGRVALMGGAFAVAGAGGWLAAIWPAQVIFLLAALLPLPALLAAFLLEEGRAAEPADGPDPRVLWGGLAFGLAMTAIGLTRPPFAEEIGFLLTLAVLLALLRVTVAAVPAETRRAMAAAALIIFAFRAAPLPGPALQWWQIDVLGYGQGFFGTLGQLGTGLAIAGALLLGGRIVRWPLGSVFIWLTVLNAAFMLPSIGMLFGLHEWTAAHLGFGAHAIGLVDTAFSAPLAQLAMIPMLTLIALHAPEGRRATWFALMASLMNLALQAGAIVSRALNAVFVVERGDYAALPALVIAVTLVGLAGPLLVIAAFRQRLDRPGDVTTSSRAGAASAGH